MSKVSLFNDNYKGVPFKHISIYEALERITSGQNIKQIDKLRSIKDKKEASKFKMNELWSVTFAGTFSYHNKESLIKASELAILDFDNVQSPAFFKQYLFNNYYHILAAWISPSGTGVKAIVRIEKVKNDAEYKEYYYSILKYFENASADEATIDICRYAFESYDPDLLKRDWDETSVWKDKIKKPEKKAKQKAISKPKNIDNSRILDVASNMIAQSIDGNKHFTLLKASRLLGGYIEGCRLDEQIAIDCLETAIQNINIDSFENAQKAIRSGISYGKLSPITHDFQTDYEQNFDIEFPIRIFPELYKSLINKLDKNLNFPVDYTAVSILFAFSVLLGNRFKIHVKNGYQTVPICWFGIVGEPGVTKSHPINRILKPLTDWDFQSYKQYKVELKDWNEIENNKEPKPLFKKYLIDDFTTEALPKIINANKNGVGIYADELASWTGNMDRYGSGNSMAKFLSIYDNGRLVIDRKTQDPEYVESVFLSIIGTIQPEVLIELFEKYSKNGFFDRFLFAFPDSVVKPLIIEDIEINEIKEHGLLVRTLIQKLDYLDDQVFHFENMQDYIDINTWLIDQLNNESVNSRMANYISKLISMIPRLAIIIEAINSIVVNGVTPLIISSNNMLKTFDLIKYFFTNAEKLLSDFATQKEIINLINGYKFQDEKVNAMREAGYKFNKIGKVLGISSQVAQNYQQKYNQKAK